MRILSMGLFLDTLGFVESSEEKMQKVAHESLLPLSIHLHDQDESVAKVGILLLWGGRCRLPWGPPSTRAGAAAGSGSPR